MYVRVCIYEDKSPVNPELASLNDHKLQFVNKHDKDYAPIHC